MHGEFHSACNAWAALAGEIMISAMGDLEGKGKGGFVLLDEDFKVMCHSDVLPLDLKIADVHLMQQCSAVV